MLLTSVSLCTRGLASVDKNSLQSLERELISIDSFLWFLDFLGVLSLFDNESSKKAINPEKLDEYDAPLLL